MIFESKKKKSRKQLDSAMLAINSMLRDIYTNKSSDEYKMKGDITKSPSYSRIEEMVADLKTLKGFDKKDADDITQLFNTLHRPVFKVMVKEYIMEQNDKNTLFTATFTVGYRLLVGELTRIYASTEATDKGIVYKPDKVSRRSEATAMIRIYNQNLEATLNKYVQDMKKYPNESPTNESYYAMIIDQMIQEGTNSIARDKVMDIPEPDQSDKSTVGPVEEEADPVDDNETPETDGGSDDTTTIQEAGGFEKGLSATAKGLAEVTGKLALYGTDIGIIATSVGIIAGLFAGVNALFKGFNPISQINYMFMNSYEKKIDKLASVSKLYDETKKAYEEYIKDPNHKKKVESKYIKNMKKYNITMQNLTAEIEHYNQRAQKESADTVNAIEQKLPSLNASDNSSDKKDDNNTNNDDDFQF